MTILILIGVAIVVGSALISGVYLFGKMAGKKSEQVEQLEEQNEILNKVARIKARTVNDSVDVIRGRLRKRIKNK